MNPLAAMFQRKAHIAGPKHINGFRKWDLKIYTNPWQRKLLWQRVMSGQVKALASWPSSLVNLLLCAQPKSASLHLHSMHSQAIDLEQHAVGFNFKGGLLYYPRLLAAKFRRKNTISHCHETPNGNLLEMVSEFDLKVIVLYRNLADALISRLEMLCRDRYCFEMLNPAAVVAFTNASPEKIAGHHHSAFLWILSQLLHGLKTWRRQTPTPCFSSTMRKCGTAPWKSSTN